MGKLPLARPKHGPWLLTSRNRPALELGGAPSVMGIVNITPDSFSDGGAYLDPKRAVDHGLLLAEQGASILDLGAESTRPGGGVYGGGCRELSAEEELGRLLPVLETLRRHLPEAWLSVDTRKGAVAKVVLEAGADMINDVGGLNDSELISAVAKAKCPVVVMHSRGELATMQKSISYQDVVQEVGDELAARIEKGRQGGIEDSQIILDPGIGFAKRQADNLSLIARLDQLEEMGRPILMGASRKSFISKIHESSPGQRLGGSLAAASWSALNGASIIRTHDVFETVQHLRVWNAIDSFS